MRRLLTPGPTAQRVGMALAGLGAAVAIAACGSSSGSSGSSSASGSSGASSSSTAPASSAPAGAHFKGSPIKLGMIANVGTAVDVHTVVAAARAGVRQVNRNGGINGHEVQLEFCNEALNPNTAQSCARRMVSQHVMAMVSNEVVTAEATDYAIFKQAGIANVGPISNTGAVGTDTNSYPLFGPEQYPITAGIHYAVADGDKRVALAVLDSPITQSYKPLASGVTRQLGGTFVGTVPVPQTAADLSTEAASLVAMKPDAVLLESSPASSLALVKSMDQLGYTGKFLTDGADFYQSQLQSLGPAANQILFTTPFPPASATNVKGIAEFRSAVTAEKAAGDGDADASPNIVLYYDEGAWLSVHLVQKIAKAAKVTTAAGFKKAIDAAKNVSTDGMTPAWTPNQTKASSAMPRVTNGAYFGFTWKNGTVKLINSTPFDVTSLVNSNYSKG